MSARGVDSVAVAAACSLCAAVANATATKLKHHGTPTSPLANDLRDGIFAAHLVAAATTAALVQGANIPLLFGRMLDLLKAMHERNPSFGPLFVRHPGDLALDRVYVPQELEAA